MHFRANKIKGATSFTILVLITYMQTPEKHVDLYKQCANNATHNNSACIITTFNGFITTWFSLGYSERFLFSIFMVLINVSEET